MSGFMKYLFIGLFVFGFTCEPGRAQATAEISGTVRDQTGAVLPGVDVTAIQTSTGAMRGAVTNETGSYVLANLPIGPYRIEAALPGFRTFVQTGIVLQVGSSPAVNPVLEVGQVTEQVEVQANAAMVETRSAGIGSVVENARILELPLNGRALIELVALSGGATPAPTLDGTGGRDPFSKGNISVAGGMNAGLNYSLDGANHNNPFDAGYLSMPFPDAMQEFKVESGASGAQNGLKSSGSVSMVTKSGTNGFHGDLFEFVRNGKFNARNSFAGERDSIKRNQFGGTLGGPVLANKMFFFAGYQGTTLRQDAADKTGFVPTAAMRAGDFTAITSPACNAGRQITLRAPFVNNRIDPARFSPAAVKFASKLPAPLDACGRLIYGIPNREDGHMAIGRIDYQVSSSHSIFGRYLFDWIKHPAPYNLNKSLLITGSVANAKQGMAQAFTIGDTYLFGANIVNSLRLTANRVAGGKIPPEFGAADGVGPADIGIKAYAALPHRPAISVTGGWGTGWSGAGPANNAIFSLNDDLSIIRGNHQIATGFNGVMSWVNSYADAYNRLSFTFNGRTTGLGMADFLVGKASAFEEGTTSDQNKQQTNLGVYIADTWKVSQRLTLNAGLRWEPYFPMNNNDGSGGHFDENAFNKGIRTPRFTNAPPGIFFQGDPGIHGAGIQSKNWTNFSPRLGFAWDVSGDGRTSIRAAAGTFYDGNPARFLVGLSNSAPWVPRLTRSDVSFDDPWANEPGGDPFPIAHGKNSPKNVDWPLYPITVTQDLESPNLQMYQWNFSVQRQVASAWLLSANYIGNHTLHISASQHINSPVFLGLGPCTLNGVRYSTCSTLANVNQRRRLTLANPAAGQYIGHLQRVDNGATASYNGLILSVQRQAAQGISLNANYTWSHCISDPGGIQTGTLGNQSYTDPNNRHFDRGNCSESASDRRHLLNLSTVAETPRFSNSALNVLASNWRFSPIFKIVAGEYLDITTSTDVGLNTIPDQRVNQVLGNPYGKKTMRNYLNPAAFSLPAVGTLGNVGKNSVRGPGYWQFDIAVSRSFQVREAQRMEFRVEAFNVTNTVFMNNPETTLNSNTFGQVLSSRDPRIMQFALKYVF
jgi:hypothetical protein